LPSRKREGGRARHHVPAHPARVVELRDRQEGPDAFARVPAGLAKRELDISADAAVYHVVSPSLSVAGVDEAAQFAQPTEELAALARGIRGPLNGELHFLSHQLERAVGVPAVEELEVPLEEGHLARVPGTRP
jgi:hypothetical protein